MLRIIFIVLAIIAVILIYRILRLVGQAENATEEEYRRQHGVAPKGS